MKLGILGGSFDPPHTGHLILAETVRDHLGLDEIVWMPVARSPFKMERDLAPTEDRLVMVERAIAGNAQFSLSTLDAEGEPPHYTVDMLEELHRQRAGVQLTFIMGADSLYDLPTWHRPNDILALAKIAAVPRPGVALDIGRLTMELPTLQERLTYIPMPLIDISSTQIRTHVSRGRSIRYLVPEAVWSYIRERGLYQNVAAVDGAPTSHR